MKLPITTLLPIVALVLVPLTPLRVQAQEAGAWREFWMTKFDEKFQMSKVRWTVWDDQPSLGRQAQWSGAYSPQSTPEGEGILDWRKPGAPDYGLSGSLKRYIGTMKGGKRHGNGALLVDSGARFDGEWQDDLRQGQGRSFFANGDYYEGSFHLGRMHGKGTYAFSGGESYTGDFENDAPHGKGVVTLADGRTYEAEFSRGTDTPETKQRRAALISSGAPATGVRLTALASPQRHEQQRRQSPEGSDDIPTYRSRVWKGEIVMEPESESFDLWKKNGVIKAEFSMGDSPALVDVYVSNDRGQPVSVVGGSVEVQRSKTDTEPLIEVRHWAYLGKEQDYEDGLEVAGMMNMVFVNNGWGTARNCVLEYHLSPDGSPPPKGAYAFTRKLGDMSQMTKIDFAEDFRTLGVNVDLVKRAFDNAPELVAQAGPAKVLARFAQFSAQGEWTSSHAQLDARLTYEWTDHEGKTRTSSSPFQVDVILDPRPLPEAGAPDMKTANYNILLKYDQDQYRIPMPLSTSVAPGSTSRFTLNFTCPRSSYHQFRIVLSLSDGSTIRSLPCRLRYFMPRLNAKKFTTAGKAPQ